MEKAAKWYIYPNKTKVKCSNVGCNNKIGSGEYAVGHFNPDSENIIYSWGCYDCGILYPDQWAGPFPTTEPIYFPSDTPTNKKTVTITSFAYKNGVPTDIPPESKVIDVRKTIKNPWRDPILRKLNGLDPKVQEYISRCGKSMKLINKNIYWLNSGYINNLYIGCQGGKHRSVAAAEITAKGVREQHPNWNVVVKHLGLEAKNGK